MADSTIQVLEGLFASSETVEDADTGETVAAKGLTATSSPKVTAGLAVPGAPGPLVLAGLAAAAYYLFFHRR